MFLYKLIFSILVTYLRYVSAFAFACRTIYLLYRNLESNQIVFYVSFCLFWIDVMILILLHYRISKGGGGCSFRIFLRESSSFSLLTLVPLLHQNGRESGWEWAVLLSRKQIFITRRPRKSKEISEQSRAFIPYTKSKRYTFEITWGNPIIIHREDTSA